jgi:hypothetical protein
MTTVIRIPIKSVSIPVFLNTCGDVFDETIGRPVGWPKNGQKPGSAMESFASSVAPPLKMRVSALRRQDRNLLTRRIGAQRFEQSLCRKFR